MKKLLEERKAADEATAQQDLARAVQIMEMWLHDGRFYVANSEPKNLAIAATEIELALARQHFPQIARH